MSIMKNYLNRDLLNQIWYVPFIGWMYPMAFMKDDTFAMEHAKQGFIMAVFFTAVLSFLAFSTVFVPINLRIVKFIIVILMYIAELAYLALCVLGTYIIVKKLDKSIPVFSVYASKVDV